MAHAVAALQIGDLYGGNSHQRHGSGSTVASSVVDSPYDSPYSTHNQSLQIANPDSSPSTYYLQDESAYTGQYHPADAFSAYPTGYKPSTLSHTPIFPAAFPSVMSGDVSRSHDDPAAMQASQHEYATPAATPRASVDPDQTAQGSKLFKIPSNDYRAQAPKIELYRTESAAFQDELYNPADFDQTAPSSKAQRPQPAIQSSQAQNKLNSPSQNLVNEYVKTADHVRSHTPLDVSVHRDRSPFRHGSPLAPHDQFHHRNSVPMLNTASAVRRQKIAQHAALEVAAHRVPFSRQETKTISPKDAMLDYNDADHDNSMSLFTDTLSDGYQQQFTSSDALFQSAGLGGISGYMPAGQNSSFGFRAIDGSSVPYQRATHSSPGATSSLRLQGQPGVQQQRRSQQFKQAPSLTSNGQPNANGPETTPEFPTNLVSMESSISDGTAMPSSQEMQPPTKRIKFSDEMSKQRPHTKSVQPITSPDHSNATESPSSPDLDVASVGSTSPPTALNTDPTDPVGHALPAAAISARNAETGPHKCTRVNRQTGQPCNIVFSRPYDLTRHEDTIHNRVKHKVECEYCKRQGEIKSFSRADALTRHMRVVHPEIEHHPGRRPKGF